MNGGAVVRDGGLRARRAATGSVRETAARAGLVARGVIYALVGVLALRIAFGDGGRQADRGGALEEIASKPFGAALLWALGIGVVGMALWRLSEAVFGAAGQDGGKVGKRLMSAARCVFYAFVAYSVLRFAAGSGGGGSSDKQSRDVTAQVLKMPGGQWLVAVAGAGLAVAGVWIAARAVLRKYHKHLKLGEMSRRVRRAVDTAGVGGGTARGVVFAVAGAFAVRAAVDYDPDKAKGLDDTLRSFADAPMGPVLLACVAAGLVLFGVFSWALARWRKV
ncbi:DUF1206 domain-containing protein [Streptomyces sp. NPDC005813]|uniref:DUF1206 domain-containing protein n=1 Tax=Streptomyces sp. NPDC005813 TaxID=3155592 RepID=UPI0034030C35